MFCFETANFVVRAVIVDDSDVDISYDETSETRDKLDSGEWQAFGTIVTVEHKGLVLGESSLWGSIYAKPADFFTEHRGCGYRGSVGSYFPDMVREAISMARLMLATLPKVRAI
jgi:hypothetical protein